MLKEDIELEKQQADEELAAILRDLVIQPIERILEEQIRNHLFDLEYKIEEKLKKQLAVVSKAKKLEDAFNELDDKLKSVELSLNAKLAEIKQQLISRHEDIKSDFLHNRSSLDFMLSQIENMKIYFNDSNDKLELLKSNLVNIENSHKTHVSSIKNSINDHYKNILQQVAGLKSEFHSDQQLIFEKNQCANNDYKNLLKDINIQLIEKLNSNAINLRKDLSSLEKQGSDYISNMHLMEKNFQQINLLFETQKNEILHLRKIIIRSLWMISMIMLLIPFAIVIFASNYPAILRNIY